MIKGKFISLEGGEGAGKSTQIEFIQDFLTEKGFKVVLTREPGGTPLAEKIRTLLLEGDSISAETELLLMFAARSEHINKVIKPALAKGFWVISDRFTDSSYAYQGGGRGIDCSYIAELERFVQKDLIPDLTLLFDVSIELGMERIQNRNHSDRIEMESIDFFKRVREAYLKQAALYPKRIQIVNADLSIDVIRNSVRNLLNNMILC